MSKLIQFYIPEGYKQRLELPAPKATAPVIPFRLAAGKKFSMLRETDFKGDWSRRMSTKRSCAI